MSLVFPSFSLKRLWNFFFFFFFAILKAYLIWSSSISHPSAATIKKGKEEEKSHAGAHWSGVSLRVCRETSSSSSSRPCLFLSFLLPSFHSALHPLFHPPISLLYLSSSSSSSTSSSSMMASFHINDESCKNIATCNITSPPSLAISLLWVHWSYLQGGRRGYGKQSKKKKKKKKKYARVSSLFFLLKGA